MRTLINFVKWWNTTPLTETFKTGDYTVTNDVHILLNKFLLPKEPGTPLRMSALGKPLVDIAYNLLEYKPEEFTAAELWVITMGDYAELLIKELMRQTGHTFTHDQAEVSIAGVVGHIDGIADNETVFDIKAMSTTYWKKFTNKLDNERGYLTQLSLYQAATKMPKAAFVCLNKVTGEMKLVKLPKRVFQEQIREVRDKLKIIKQIQSEQDIVKLVQPEEPTLRKGALVVPPSMQFSQHLNTIYGGTDFIDEDYFKGKWLT